MAAQVQSGERDDGSKLPGRVKDGTRMVDPLAQVDSALEHVNPISELRPSRDIQARFPFYIGASLGIIPIQLNRDGKDKDKGVLHLAVKSKNADAALQYSQWIIKHLQLSEPGYWPSKLDLKWSRVPSDGISLERLARQKSDDEILRRFPAYVGNDLKIVPLAFYPDESNKKKGLVVLGVPATGLEAAKRQELWIKEMLGMEENITPRWPIDLSMEFVVVPEEVVRDRLPQLREEQKRQYAPDEPQTVVTQVPTAAPTTSPYTDAQAAKKQSEQPVQQNDWAPVIDLRAINMDPNIAVLVAIFRQAVDAGASDVHFNTKRLPTGTTVVKVRMRKDGLMRPILDLRERDLVLEGDAGRSIIRILGNNAGRAVTPVDLHMYPQDGKAVLIGRNNERMDVRLAFAPVATVHQGVDVVARILESDKPIAFRDLSLSKKHEEIVKRQLKYSSGVYIWTGPTGEGKTTSLRALLGEVDTPEINMITVEDPVEYSVPNASQREVFMDNERMNWKAQLKAALRMDPDVVLIGEIRDSESAKIAVQAAMTGHQVFTTLHTIDALAAIERLVDLGIPPAVLTATVRIIAAQRLVRKLAPECWESTPLTATQVEVMYGVSLGLPPDQVLTIPQLKPEFDLGDSEIYKGRLGVHQMIEFTPALKALINKGEPVAVLREFAQKNHVDTLFTDGFYKVLEGRTSMEEIVGFYGLQE